MRLGGTMAGAAGVILTVVITPQQPWFQLPLIALLIGASAFYPRDHHVSVRRDAQRDHRRDLFSAATLAQPATRRIEGPVAPTRIAVAEMIAAAVHLLLWARRP